MIHQNASSVPTEHQPHAPCNTIRLAGIEYDDTVNGPGLRVAVFLQGCKFHCPECHNPETWALDKGELVSPGVLVDRITADRAAKRVTWTGGEATLQWHALLPVVTDLANLGYSQMLYTGYEPDELQQLMVDEPEFAVFISHMTYVITGRFIREQRSLDLRFRGSRNQRVMMPASEGGYVYLEDVTTTFDRGEYYE